MTKTPITVAKGDGIGPEIMDATLEILDAAGAQLDLEEIVIGERMYDQGIMNGISDDAWESLHRTKVFLKSPITTPQGGGFKSLNVTVRKSLGLYANVRPCVAYHPYVESNFPGMDIVIIRENEEDLYAGIEHRQTQDVMQSLKIISRPGSEKIIRYAFEYAKANGRKKVTCMAKDNIMKMADGLFHRIFDEIGAEYPEIEQDFYIIDIGMARVAARPHDFDVIVTENLYGDIISDIAVEITGSVGLGGSCNIGDDFGMFEAVHGSAPTMDRDKANPSGLLFGSLLMMNHIGQNEIATKVHNAWYKTIEDGIHTGDIYDADLSKENVGTAGFAKAVIERLGAMPEKFTAVDYGTGGGGAMSLPPVRPRVEQKKELIGCDIFLHWEGKPDDLAAQLNGLSGAMELKVLSNRGVKVWPEGQPGTFCSDHWCARFKGASDHGDVLDKLSAVKGAGLDFIKIENLSTFDGEDGFTKAQGE